MDTIKINKKNTKIVAHRGVCGLETENTAASFIAAGNRSYYAIETDVQVTSDGVFVVMHDDTTGRLANVDLSIGKTSYSVLKDICLNEVLYGEEGVSSKPRSDLRIPTLSEYIKICKKYQKKCVIELKGTFSPENVDRLLEVVKNEGYMEESLFISWDINALIRIREKHPDREIIVNIANFNDEVLANLNKYSFEISLRCDKVSKELVDIIHSNGRKIYVWYANTKEESERMADWDVDYIASNIFE